MAGTYISLDRAQEITAQINALQPPISYAEQARVAYAATPATTNEQPGGERDYYAVWKDCGFSQNCKLAGDSMTGYPGSWAEMMKNEYDAWMAHHEPASQYGLPEGLTWVFVE